jgi:hypothetical protein
LSFKALADILPRNCSLYPEIAVANQPEVVHPEVAGLSFKTLADILETDRDSSADFPRTCLLYPEIAALTLEPEGLAKTSENNFLSSQANENERIYCGTVTINTLESSFEFKNCHFSSEMQRSAEKDGQVNPENGRVAGNDLQVNSELKRKAEEDPKINPELQRNPEKDLQVNLECQRNAVEDPQVNPDLQRNLEKDLQVNPEWLRFAENDLQVNPENEQVAGKDHQINPDAESGTSMTESVYTHTRPVLEPSSGDNSKKNSWDRFYKILFRPKTFQI